MASNIPVIVQGNSFSLAIPLQIYYINEGQMDLQDYTPDPTDDVTVQLKGSRRNYTYTPTIDGNVANIDLTGNELADNYSVVVSIVKDNGQRLRSFRTDQFFIVESSDDLTTDDIIQGLEENVIYLNASIFVAGEDGRGIESIAKTSTSGLVDTYTITYTDATTSTFNVTNGAQGQDGQQGADGVGITSIEKTSTSGLVDTYTITLSNGQTSTFEVTNGQDGHDLGLAAIVNNLTDGGEEDALSAEMGKVLMYGASSGDEVFEWERTNKYMAINTIGGTATEGDYNGGGYIKIPVRAGDAFAIISHGTTTGPRTWGLTDVDLKVLANTSSVYDYIPAFVVASVDGFLICNNQFNNIPSPKVTKIISGTIGEMQLENNTGYVTCSTIGNGAAYSAANGWGCIAVPVVAGQKATIYTKGGSNGRAWALYGEGQKVLSNAVASLDATVTPAVVNVTETCILVVNCNFSSLSITPKVTIEGGGATTQPCLVDLDERVEALEALHPQKPLMILAIGNSFTENSLEYMPNFLSNLNVGGLIIYRMSIGGSTIANWWTMYQNNTSVSPTKIVGSAIDNIGTTLKTIFAHDWDYIVFQQYSVSSATYSTIEPNLYSLIAHAKADCTNKECKVAWHLTWSWCSLDSGSAPKGVSGYESIASMVDTMLDYYKGCGLDVIIPTGTALQNARGTSLNNEAELTSDYHHAAGGVGKYILTATWYEVLISAFAGKSMLESTLDVSATASSSDLGAESVDSTNRNLCLMCAQYAVNNKLHISTIVE